MLLWDGAVVVGSLHTACVRRVFVSEGRQQSHREKVVEEAVVVQWFFFFFFRPTLLYSTFMTGIARGNRPESLTTLNERSVRWGSFSADEALGRKASSGGGAAGSEGGGVRGETHGSKERGEAGETVVTGTVYCSDVFQTILQKLNAINIYERIIHA